MLSILIFLGPIIFLALFMELSLRKIPNDYLFKKEYLDANANNIKTLVMGSSHSFYGIDPSFFLTNTFNGANISQSLDYDYKILKLYENNLDSLKVLVLPISYFSLYSNLKNTSEHWRIKNYNIYYGMNSTYALEYNAEIFGNNFKNNIGRLSSYYLRNNDNKTSSELGWGTDYSSENSMNLFKTGEIASLRHSWKDLHSFKNSPDYLENQEILNNIIRWSQKRDVKVLLFTPPAYYTYRQNMIKEQLYNTEKVIEQIALEYDNCIYYNFFYDTSFTSEDFFDADHLNEIGAKKLSLIINDLICNSK